MTLNLLLSKRIRKSKLEDYVILMVLMDPHYCMLMLCVFYEVVMDWISAKEFGGVDSGRSFIKWQTQSKP